MEEPPFKERHCLICSQLSIQVGELSPTKWDLWVILADRRHALPWTQNSEESSLHCVPCGCCNVRMLYPPGLNTLQAERAELLLTCTLRLQERPGQTPCQQWQNHPSQSRLSIFYLSNLLPSRNFLPSRAEACCCVATPTSHIPNLRVGVVKINTMTKSLQVTTGRS